MSLASMTDFARAEACATPWRLTWDALTSWTPAINLGGTATSDTVCSEFGSAGKVVCFGRGTNSALWVNLFKGGTWSVTGWTGWASLSGLVESKASCGLLAASQIVCGVQGTVDSALWTNQFNGTA